MTAAGRLARSPRPSPPRTSRAGDPSPNAGTGATPVRHARSSSQPPHRNTRPATPTHGPDDRRRTPRTLAQTVAAKDQPRRGPEPERRHRRDTRAPRAEQLPARASKENLTTLRELAEAGKIAPAVERTYPLSEAAEAIRHLEVEHARAKIVVTV
ncbi:zinc-binding dehydrogenase [Streptomyces canus]